MAHTKDRDSQLQFLTELVDARVGIAGDVLRIGDATWALHGLIPVDGNVLVAEYATREEAQATLDRLGPPTTA